MVAMLSLNRFCLNMHSICTLYIHEKPSCDSGIDDIGVP